MSSNAEPSLRQRSIADATKRWGWSADDRTILGRSLGWASIPDSVKFPARASLEGEGIVILRTKTGFRGVQRSCPHMQATMMNAELTANDTMVRCPLHVFTFKLSDGKGVNCPGFRLKVYEIKEEDGVLFGRERKLTRTAIGRSGANWVMSCC